VEENMQPIKNDPENPALDKDEEIVDTNKVDVQDDTTSDNEDPVENTDKDTPGVKKRIDKLVEERNKLRQMLEEREQKDREAEEKRQRENGEFEQLAKTYKARLEELEPKLKQAEEVSEKFREKERERLMKKIARLPEGIRALAPDLESTDLFKLSEWADKASETAKTESEKPGLGKSPDPVGEAGSGKRKEEAMKAQKSMYRL
jgi:chromosome segregation ATPase